MCVLLERCWTSTYIHLQDERCDVRNYSTDHILNYASCALGLGLLAQNFHDATCEGDGGRTVRCWKCLLLHYRFDGHIKYAPEAFVLLAQLNAFLTPRMAHELMWNRSCTTKAGRHNLQLDLHFEHLNGVFKDNINIFSAHIPEQSVSHSARAIGQLDDLIHKFDLQMNRKRQAPADDQMEAPRPAPKLAMADTDFVW